MELPWHENFNFIHGIVEFELWLTFMIKNQTFFIGERIFFLANIIGRVYEVLVIAALVVQHFIWQKLWGKKNVHCRQNSSLI